MEVVGILVHARQERSEEVGAALTKIPGAEIHQVTDDGRMIVTVESEKPGGGAASLITLAALPGVLSASLTYHYFESDEDGATYEESGNGCITA